MDEPAGTAQIRGPTVSPLSAARLWFPIHRAPRACTWAGFLVPVAVLMFAIASDLSAGLGQLPHAPRPDIAVPWRDATPVNSTITVDWRKVHLTVRADELRYRSPLWRHMHFDDWDRVPVAIREEALKRMARWYAPVVAAPSAWDRMTAADWDGIPQPIRAAAYINMVRYWSGYYQVGAAFGLPRGLVTDTMCAIVMQESWFEHRAVSLSRSGNRDLGLGQTSDGTRAALSRLLEAGVVDFAPASEDDYFDPWQAARAVAIWFELMLQETGGQLDAAVRAYHVGSSDAKTLGVEYLADVEEKRWRFIRNGNSTPSWDILFRRFLDSRPRPAPSASIVP